MVASIELLFDERTDAALRQCWELLSEAGLPSQGTISAATNRPHLTLLVADTLTADVDAPLRRLTQRLPLPAVVGAPMWFGAGALTLVRLIVPSAELLNLHAAVFAACQPHLVGPVAPHTAPGTWTPHTTLARRMSGRQLGRAAELAKLGRELRGSCTGLRRWDGAARVEHHLTA